MFQSEVLRMLLICHVLSGIVENAENFGFSTRDIIHIAACVSFLELTDCTASVVVAI